ncbi:uncharacterized protein EDB93DRAFT_1245051 [Suillus bovinus]|uniref:uncharacterized protein n=1 Tax=Suillus bovinus TaxID=48563 RepID=UPI001B882F24|nr:uncharacterized protein EDB93DRAFT_1245051 [Suillus bovinus]KAG2159235.1 hypothetical protein EDB93DRAFT_1245051 [Suillus bovinus]
MSQPCDEPVAVAHRPALRERAGQPLSTPAPVGYPTSLHASRPLRSSPLAGLAFSSNPSIASFDSSQSQCPSLFSVDVGSYSRSRPSSVMSHTGSISATTSSHAHRAPRPLVGPSKSAGAIPTLGLDARPYSRSPPSSVVSYTGSASSSSFSSHAHRIPTTGPTKSVIPTLSLFRRHPKDEPAAPLPTQASFGHSRSASFPSQTVLTPAHVPQAYSPSVARPISQKPSVSRNPNDNWMSSSPFGPASTPRFSRQSISSQPVVMPLSAREYRRRKCASMMTNTVYSATSGSPVFGKEGVNSLPDIIEASGSSPSVSPSGNRSSRRASSPSLPSSRVSHVSLSPGSRESALSETSSISSSFFSLSSENEAENAVISTVDPGVIRRKSYPNPTQRHSRISLVDAVSRLSQMSGASGDTVFLDMDDDLGPRQRQISVTEDDGVLRRANSRRVLRKASSRRKKSDAPTREPLMADTAAQPTASQERTRVVRILEVSEVSPVPVSDSRFSGTSHDREELVSGDISTEQATPESKVDLKASGTPSVEAHVRSRKKLTKSRKPPVQVPPAQLAAASLPWIPRPSSPFFRASARQNTPNVPTPDATLQEDVLPTEEEIGDNGKENKRPSRRLTFQFIPSPSFHRQPKLASQSLDVKSPMRTDTRQRMPETDSRYGIDNSLTGSATTITLLPPPPITSSSSVSSSAGNSSSSLTDGSSTMGSRDTGATSINASSLQTTSRGAEYSSPKIPSNLKQSMVVQWGSDTDSDQQDDSGHAHASKTCVDPPNASHDQESQPSSSSFCTVTSYASFASYGTSGSAPAALDTRNGFHGQDQAPDPNVHPMWTVPMVTITAASPTVPAPRAKEISPVIPSPLVKPSFLAVPIPVPTPKPTARLKRPRPRPQTAPASPTVPHFPTPPTPKSPRAAGASSRFKSIFRTLLNRAG